MKLIKRISAAFLALIMLATMIVATGISASAIAGGGVASSTYRAYGCDLSFWNVGGSSLDYSLVDFAKMKADGCEFAILRIGFEGSATRANTIDQAFVQYYNSARAAGMPLGVYFYSLATTYAGAVDDANWVISIIEKYDMYFEYPIYYDVEDSAQTALGSTAMNNLCLGWCETLEAAGYFPGVYGGKSQVIDKLSSSFTSQYDIWYPRVAVNGHGTQYNPNNYDYSNICNMWQYAWYDYEYNGIGLDMLDVNVCYKNYPALMAQYGYNNCGVSLSTVITEAVSAVYTDYSPEALTALHAVYNEAVALNNSSSATAAQKSAMVEKLQLALACKATATNIVSVGASYTTTANTRTDMWADDKIRLTDGAKGNTDGGTAGYSGWGNEITAEIIVDLGAPFASNSYTVYGASNSEWGIAAVNSLTVYASNDGVNFTQVGDIDWEETVVNTTTTWATYTMNVVLETPVSARYIKFALDPIGYHTWTDEVEVALTPATAASGEVYVGAINSKIRSGDCHIFTPSFGTITTTTANHAFTANLIATWSDKYNAYLVTQTVVYGTGTDTADITLASNQILIAAHKWEGTNITDPVAGSSDNCNNLGSMKVGDVLELNGINLSAGTVSAAAYVSFYTKGNVNDDDSVSAVDYALAKRACLGSYKLDDGQTLRGDIDADGSVTPVDYMLIKRICLDTYHVGV